MIHAWSCFHMIFVFLSVLVIAHFFTWCLWVPWFVSRYMEKHSWVHIYMYTPLYVCNLMCCLRFDNAWLLHKFSLLELATHCIEFVLCWFYHLLAKGCILMAPSKRFWVLTHTQVWLYSCHRLEKWIHVAIFFLFWWYSLSEDSLSENVRHSLCEEEWSNL